MNNLIARPQEQPEQPEHLNTAIGFANEILSRYSLSEQNEIIDFVIQRVRESRQNEIKHLEERISIIKDFEAKMRFQ